MMPEGKRYKLTDAAGQIYESLVKGEYGAYRGENYDWVYGTMDCPSANAHIARGNYTTHRRFFEDEETAIAAGHRPCGRCLHAKYRAWKAAGMPKNPADVLAAVRGVE